MIRDLVEDKNGTYLSMLMNEYKSKVQKMRLEQMQEELKGKSTNFESIFANDPFREELKENKVLLGFKYSLSFLGTRGAKRRVF